MVSMMSSITAQDERSIIIEDGKVIIKNDTTEVIIERRSTKESRGEADGDRRTLEGDIDDRMDDMEEKIEDKMDEVEEKIEDAMDEVEDVIEQVEEEVERIFQDENGVVEEDEEYESDEEMKEYSGKKKKKNKFRVGMLDYGFSSLLYDGSFSTPTEYDQFSLNQGRSHNLNLHIFRHRVNLISETLFFEYGLSVNWRRYNLENDIIFDTDPIELESGLRTLTFSDSEVENKKNKFRTSNLEIPVMLTISPKDSKFFISGGGYAGIRLGSSQKLKSQDEGKTVIKGDYGLRDFNYGLVGRIGFGPVDFFCQYSLVSLFDDNVLPEDVRPITFGISMLGF